MINDLDNQIFHDNNKCWRVSRLIELASHLQSFQIPLKHLNIWNMHPEAVSTLEFVDHVHRVLDADLSFPIILDEEGWIMDGRHRVLKALLYDEKKILAVRFEKTPLPCYLDNKT